MKEGSLGKDVATKQPQVHFPESLLPAGIMISWMLTSPGSISVEKVGSLASQTFVFSSQKANAKIGNGKARQKLKKEDSMPMKE